VKIIVPGEDLNRYEPIKRGPTAEIVRHSVSKIIVPGDSPEAYVPIKRVPEEGKRKRKP